MALLYWGWKERGRQLCKKYSYVLKSLFSPLSWQEEAVTVRKLLTLLFHVGKYRQEKTWNLEKCIAQITVPEKPGLGCVKDQGCAWVHSCVGEWTQVGMCRKFWAGFGCQGAVAEVQVVAVLSLIFLVEAPVLGLGEAGGDEGSIIFKSPCASYLGLFLFLP